MSYDLLVRAHLAFGTMALVSFWVQMVSRKGGALHRLGGRFYFAVMILVISTAIPMTLLLIRRDDLGAGLLLGFLGTITMSSGASALMAARWKGQHIERQRRISHGFSYMLLIVSLLLLGLTPWAGLLSLGLGCFGAWAAISDLRTKINAPIWSSWLARHIEGTFGTGIAVHVAFFAFGLRGLLGTSYTPLHFLFAFAVPTLVGMTAASIVTRRYVPLAAGDLANRSQG